MKFLSDDYCLLNFNPEPTVHALYNTTKLKGEEDINRFAILLKGGFSYLNYTNDINKSIDDLVPPPSAHINE